MRGTTSVFGCFCARQSFSSAENILSNKSFLEKLLWRRRKLPITLKHNGRDVCTWTTGDNVDDCEYNSQDFSHNNDYDNEDAVAHHYHNDDGDDNNDNNDNEGDDNENLKPCMGA